MSHIYGLDKEGQDLADAASRIARDVAGVNAADVDSKGRFPEESLAALARDGFMGLTLPRSVGGTESPPRVFGAVVEELAHVPIEASLLTDIDGVGSRGRA